MRDTVSKVDMHRLDNGVSKFSVSNLSPTSAFVTYSCSAYSPISLPIPDCLYPPNGTFVETMLPEFTHTDPALSLCADSIALVIFWLKTYAARPYVESLAFLIMSS